MNKAHVFQHKIAGVQIFIYHCISENTARAEFMNLVIDYRDWIYLGQKTAQDA